MLRPVALVVLLIASLTAHAESLPTEYFVKDGDYLDVALSPSGKRLAAQARVNGMVVMAVIDRASNQVVGGVRPEADSAIHSVDWINDERLVFSYAAEVYGLDQPVATGELFGINYDGSGRELLAGYRASDARTGSRLSNKESDRSSFFLVDTLEGEAKHVLVIEYPWSKDGRLWYDNRQKLPTVSRLNVNSGKKKTVEVLPFRNAYPYVSRDGTLRFVTYENEAGLAEAAYRENRDAEWQSLAGVFDLADEMIVVGLNDAGNAAFLKGRFGEDQFYTIYRLDFANKSYDALFTDLDADIVDWIEDPATGEIVVGKSERAKPRYHYAAVDSSIKTTHKKLAKAFAGQAVDIVSATDDGSELMVRVSSDTNPGEFYIFDTDTNKADFFWANMSWIDPRKMRPMIVDDVTTEDGLKLPVRLTLPEGDGPAPLIVHPHGGPHGVADTWGFNHEVQLLASRGYAVLQVNFRGSGYFGDRFMKAGYQEWGGKMIEDIATATHWAMQRPDIDETRVCAYGASYGAYAAYMLAVREPDLLTCTAGYVGVYDLNIMFSKGDIPQNWGGLGYLQRVLGTDPARLAEFSPVNHADKIQAETLLIHGDADRRAPIAHARAMRKALQDAGTEPGWIRLDQSGHGAGSLENRLELYEGLLAFLDSNLMTPGP